ncbi:MAG TPA: hypothetical protein VFZ87_10240 [Gemmatimonadales bacterium]
MVVPSRLAAQLPPVGVPGGVVRVELDGSLSAFDQRFRAGRLEPYGADLASSTLGSDRIPLLADAEARIGRVIGNTGYRINLGGLSTDAHADVGTGFLGLSLGLTSGITVFGRIPLVRSRVQSAFQLDPSAADAGLNPGEDTQLPFFAELDAALTTLSARLAAGDYDGDPAQRALAQSTLADATTLRGDLFALLADPATASPALPTATSAAGTALGARITTLQTTLSANLGISGFSLTPNLPGSALTEAEFMQIVTNPVGPIDLRLDEVTRTFRGDAEVGASLTLIDRWDRDARRGGLRVAVSGLVRLPTGRREQSDHPLDIGTGDGQTDVQVELVTDVGAGPIGARLSGTYVRQLARTFQTRVTAPSQPFVGPDRLRFVRGDPGDIVALGVHPFYRLARTLALQAGLEHWSRGTDAYSYSPPADALPGIDANVLAEESKANATALSLGITYANPGGLRRGGTGLPVDAGWRYERILRSGGGRVPDTHVVRGQFRIYFGLW